MHPQSGIDHAALGLRRHAAAAAGVVDGARCGRESRPAARRPSTQPGRPLACPRSGRAGPGFVAGGQSGGRRPARWPHRPRCPGNWAGCAAAAPGRARQCRCGRCWWAAGVKAQNKAWPGVRPQQRPPGHGFRTKASRWTATPKPCSAASATLGPVQSSANRAQIKGRAP